MGTARLEAFSDGVIAIIITIMVLELKAPHGADLHALLPVIPTFLSYVLSFVFVGIYWNNHHHMLHITETLSGAALWANLHLLFWLSLVPFTTAFMDENEFAPVPVALYGVVLLMAGFAYYILGRVLIRDNGREGALAKAFGRDRKALFSVLSYAAAIGLSFVNVSVALGLYVLVAIVWIVPDRRVEAAVKAS